MRKGIVDFLFCVIMISLMGCGAVSADIPEPETMIETTANVAANTTSADEYMNKDDESIPVAVRDLYSSFIDTKDKYGGVAMQKKIEEPTGASDTYSWELYSRVTGEDYRTRLSTSISDSGEVTGFSIFIDDEANIDDKKAVVAWTIMTVDTSYSKTTADALATQLFNSYDGVNDSEMIKTHTYTFFLQPPLPDLVGILPPELVAKKNDSLSDVKMDTVENQSTQ